MSEEVVGLNDRFNLTAEQVDQLSLDALDGSIESARKLYLYYSMINANREREIYWATIAAENGGVSDQYNLGYILSNDPDLGNQRRSIFWLKKSAKAGHDIAKEYLKELEGRSIGTKAAE